MKEELKLKLPELAKIKGEVEQMIQQINVDKASASETKKVLFLQRPFINCG